MPKIFLTVGLLTLFAASTQAGMPSPRLTDVAAARLDSISFFLAGYALCAVIFRWVWNHLAKDFPWMPSLTFGRSLAMLVVVGLFMYFILTMVSGARELMTPGAWARNGSTYQLTSAQENRSAWLESARQNTIEQLRAELREYAAKHDGKLPPHLFVADFEARLWKGIDPTGTWIGYIPGKTFSAPATVLAYEPSSYGAKRWALLTDGSILLIPSDELDARVRKEFQP